jgi:ClpP class serine protease
MSFLLERYLAIEEGALATYLNAINNKAVIAGIEDKTPTELVAANNLSRKELGWVGIPSAELDGKLVAVVDLRGFMDPNYSAYVAAKIRVADENNNVVATVIRANTPGGAVNGTAALAAVIAKAEKPTLGFTDFMCASAGIYAVSQTNEHWIGSAKNTGVGSVGIMGTYMSEAEKLKNDGYDVRVLRSKGSEDKNLLNSMEPINEAALAEEQLRIDAMRVEMLATIRSKRPRVDPAITGRMFYGSDVIKAGLADYVGDFQAVINRAFYLGLRK